MKTLATLLASVALAFGPMIGDAEAKRFGGGKSSGMQRSSAPDSPGAAPKDAGKPAATPNSAANPASAAPAVPPAKPSFMSRWGGVLAGLGMGALLGSMFSGGLGGLGSILMMVLLAAAVFFVVRMVMRSRASPRAGQFAAAGNAPHFRDSAEPSFGNAAERSSTRSSGSFGAGTSGGSFGSSPSAASGLPPGFDSESFVRLAKTSFVRLQAANDAGDLADIRATTTPEMYAEIAMQMRERGNAPQHTEIVSLDARVLEMAAEGDDVIVSLRYSGTVQEATGTPIEPFDEIWHLRRPQDDPKAPWLIAGIQQTGAVAVH